MTTPLTTIASISRLIEDIRTAWPTFEETIAAHGMSTHPGTLGTGSHGGDVPDPVYAANIPDEWDEACAELAEVRGHLVHILDVIHRIGKDHPATARHHEAAARAARCSEPACTELAVKDGLCWTDWQHQRQQSRRPPRTA